MRSTTLRLLICASFYLFAGCECGDDTPGDVDGGGDSGPEIDSGGVVGRCGDMMVEGTEECDDGNRDPDDGCSADCQSECGDGRVSGVEICDPGIAAGETGACPTACDDADACTTDALDGTGCSASCSFAPISAAIDGDGCCAPPNDATNDSDCTFICGNGVLETGEVCDTGIGVGLAGACPTSCDDGMACTADTVSMAGTCNATCQSAPITAAADGDGCCLSGDTLADDSDCPIACGDGVVSSGETCDTGIGAGSTGACPSACDDGNACTTDALSNDGTCDAICTTTLITAEIAGDGCCPPGGTGADADCTGTCGDGTVSGGETCDTAITTGTGACPTSCPSDGFACTSDSLAGAGGCSAACIYQLISTPANGDGCCPSGATRANDDDCPTVCGDAFVSGTETCDTAITTGTGACPTSCDDGMMCTTDSVFGAGTCDARCVAMPVGAGPADTCCPPGATLRTDPDCPAACGDMVVTAPEACDDGNLVSGDGCSSTCTLEPVAFRFTDLDLRDPHVYAEVFGCLDVTNLEAFGVQGVNPAIQTNIAGDASGDGFLDLSIAQVFNPLAQAAGTTTPSYLVFPSCTYPMSSTSCTLAAGAMRTAATAMNVGSGVCLDIVAGTTRATYMPGIVIPTAPAGGTCYVAAAGTVMLSLSGIPITLQDAQIAGEWFGTPATEIRDGLLRGFISEADADATVIPPGTTGINTIDGQPLSSLLRGGVSSCQDPSPAVGDKDTFTPPGGGAPVTGWYFYLNFTAVRVPYTEL